MTRKPIIHFICVVALAIGTTASPSSATTEPEPVRIEIEAAMIGLMFEPRSFAVQPGQEVELVLRNASNGMVHNLLIVRPNTVDEVAAMALDLGAEGPEAEWVPDTENVLHHTSVVPPGEEETLHFVAPEIEGNYPFVCTIPGHAQTMRGTMRVTRDAEPTITTAATRSDNAERGKPEEALRYESMDTGPFYSGVIEIPGGNILDKGLAIRLGEERQATVHFDTDLLRMSAGWTGAFLEFHTEHDAGTRNDPPPSAMGTIRFTSSAIAGWVEGAERFRDPRPRAFGPMPETHGRYKGLYLHGHRTVLAYTVRNTTIHETPWFIENGETGAFTRDLLIEERDRPLSVLLFDGMESGLTEESHNGLRLVRAEAGDRLIIAAMRPHPNAVLETAGGQAIMRVESNSNPVNLRVWIWEGQADKLDAFIDLATRYPEADDLRALKEPGPARWGDPIVTTGHRGHGDGAYVIDSIRGPRDNPHNAVLHFSGIDFTEDGRAALTTMHGDVWLVDGIDDSLEKVTWTRFATGLNNPFGLRVLGDEIYVATEDELTVLRDRNGDGEADFYGNFHNLITPGAGAWRQAFGLEVDDEGAFYFARGRGRWGSAYTNGIIRVSPNGDSMEVIATGFRQPWAIGLSPEGHVTVSQQEGPWVPQTPVHMIDTESRKGAFYGFDPNNFRSEDPYPRDLGFEPPIVWLPRHIDNTGSGQVWVESNEWGVPPGTMLHLSGGSRVLQLFYDKVDGDRQGGVVALARLNMWRPRMGRFHPGDRQLYVIGPFPEGALERVRYTGNTVHVPVALRAHENGLRIRFNHPISPDAADPENFRILRWNYEWSQAYGSDFFSAENPGQRGQDPVEVTAVLPVESNESGHREIFLEIPDMQTAMQLRLSYRLKAADGTPMSDEIYSTIHALRPSWHRIATNPINR